MEWLQQETIHKTLLKRRPKFWKRYVDDIMDVARKWSVVDPTYHLNQVDPTNSIKFTHEAGHENQISFLDTLIVKNKWFDQAINTENPYSSTQTWR